jgi:tRNA 2-thiouridine synthesizing protein A
MSSSNQKSSYDHKAIACKDLLKIDVVLEIDARGLHCPMPLLKAKQALYAIAAGDKLRVVATDRGSVRDFHAFAALSGHNVQAFSEKEGEFYYVLIKKL